jgi:hypothetical protein
MVLTQEQTIIINPVANIIKTTILAAFTFLTALAVRDVFIKTMEAVLPDKANEKLVFIYFYASLVTLFTVLLAYLWRYDNKL